MHQGDTVRAPRYTKERTKLTLSQSDARAPLRIKGVRKEAMPAPSLNIFPKAVNQRPIFSKQFA
jgi:hypothetical protein